MDVPLLQPRRRRRRLPPRASVSRLQRLFPRAALPLLLTAARGRPPRSSARSSVPRLTLPTTPRHHPSRRSAHSQQTLKFAQPQLCSIRGGLSPQLVPAARPQPVSRRRHFSSSFSPRKLALPPRSEHPQVLPRSSAAKVEARRSHISNRSCTTGSSRRGTAGSNRGSSDARRSSCRRTDRRPRALLPKLLGLRLV